MGVMVGGIWRCDRRFATDANGRFVRAQSSFRDQVSADGATGFRAEPGRYHLYVSLACPWAHRTLILRALKGLADVVSISVVEPVMGDEGWRFGDGPGCIPDTVNGFAFLHQVYAKADAGYSGRVTVPVLWDRERATIVNNESVDILRMFNRAFDAFGDAARDFYPEDLRHEIDRVNAVIYENINNGVYRAGFATSQVAYDEAFEALFSTLDELEQGLGRRRYLAGRRITEADWRLFTTLVRFDAVYHGHFKCNKRRLVDYPNLWGYVRELFQVPGVAATVNMNHIKTHYYRSHPGLNPSGIVPRGPEIDFHAPHGRDRLVRERSRGE